MTENDVNPPFNNDPMEKKKQIYQSPLVLTYNKLITDIDKIFSTNVNKEIDLLC